MKKVGAQAVHLCVDMQQLFGPGSPWAVPWAENILPQIQRLCAHAPHRALFTRFVPVRYPEEAGGVWQVYYQKWRSVTRDEIGDWAIELLPALQVFTPPAQIIDKTVYSPWLDPQLEQLLLRGKIDTLLISGGETDVCILATVLGAIDRGFRVILVADALCSSDDETHAAVMQLFRQRFDLQVEIATTDQVIEAWHVD